jgi:sirohydrochlorin cobaltochelatase
MTSALVIAGHGSHLSPYTAAPAWQHADAIRAMGVFDEVTCAFWKEMPSLHRVLATLTADDVTIVPLFTSQGYFSRTVLPTELGLDGPVTVRGERTIRYTETVGQHPHMTDVVRSRAESVLTQYSLDPSRTALVLVGHGTRRDRESAVATQRQAEIIRAEARFAEVAALYLDEPPEINKLYEMTHSPTIIVVPFFVAGGSHTQEDIPRALQLSADPRRLGYSVPAYVDGRTVYYMPAVGMEPSVHEVILDLCRAAGATLKPSQATSNPWVGFPRAGLDQLQETQFPLHFGQVLIEAKDDEFTIRHIDDQAPQQHIDNPSVLRQLLSLDANGNFRALRTGIDMPRGWYVKVTSFEMLLAALETIYPTAWIDYVQQQNQTLPTQTMEQVAERQTGIYRLVAKLPSTRLPDIVAAHCGSCVRQPTWFDGVATDGKLPCPEPCQCWMSFALQQVEADRKPKVPFEFSADELQSLRAALDTAVAQTNAQAAEYEDPRNPSRLRALQARLSEDTASH